MTNKFQLGDDVAVISTSASYGTFFNGCVFGVIDCDLSDSDRHIYIVKLLRNKPSTAWCPFDREYVFPEGVLELVK